MGPAYEDYISAVAAEMNVDRNQIQSLIQFIFDLSSSSSSSSLSTYDQVSQFVDENRDLFMAMIRYIADKANLPMDQVNDFLARLPEAYEQAANIDYRDLVRQAIQNSTSSTFTFNATDVALVDMMFDMMDNLTTAQSISMAQDLLVQYNVS